VACCFHINEFLASPRCRRLRNALRLFIILGSALCLLLLDDASLIVSSAAELLIALLSIRDLFLASTNGITYAEYRVVVSAANQLSNGAYTAPRPWHTLLLGADDLVLRESGAAYVALDLEQLLARAPGAEPTDLVA
jgi:hypothetical protein